MTVIYNVAQKRTAKEVFEATKAVVLRPDSGMRLYKSTNAKKTKIVEVTEWSMNLVKHLYCCANSVSYVLIVVLLTACSNPLHITKERFEKVDRLLRNSTHMRIDSLKRIMNSTGVELTKYDFKFDVEDYRFLRSSLYYYQTKSYTSIVLITLCDGADSLKLAECAERYKDLADWQRYQLATSNQSICKIKIFAYDYASVDSLVKEYVFERGLDRLPSP